MEMHNFKSYLIISLVAFLLPFFLLTNRSLAVPQELVRNERGIARIGVILGQTSRPGKEAKVSIEIAVQDFNIRTNQSSVLYLQNSLNKPYRAANAVKELINEHGVNAILGGHTWEEASSIAEVISEAHHDIPVFLSLADTTQLQATDQWPFLVQAVPTQSTQMKAVAAILQSWGIRQVTLIYETSNLASSSSSIISHLSQAFHQTRCELTHILPLSSGSCSLRKELGVLKRQNRQVFIIHTSLELGIRLFQTAKKMEMTGDGYLWIATNEITDLLHSINSTMLSSLKGMVGVKSDFPENTPDFQDFRKRFRQKFRSDYPEEDQDEPGIFAVQAYNAVKLLETNSPGNFHHRLISVTTVEVVSVIGRKGYHSVYWTKELGFSDTINDMKPWYGHRWHRNLAESSNNVMKVGVPGRSLFKQFVNVESDDEKNETVFSGFVIAVFYEMMRRMNQPFKYEVFNGSYEDLIKSIPKKTFDAVADDVTILSERHKYADFTQPFTESGLQMIVPVRSQFSNQAWLFLKPFTAEMWWLIIAITIYNGFIIWLIERKHSEYLRGSLITQIGIVFWLAFTTLFTLRGDRLHSNLSRMAMVMWLFVALIITQSYTANLSSMLTAQRIEPAITSVENLINMNATVGYCDGMFIRDYLRDVLDFTDSRIKSYNSTHQYAEALNSGEIAAIFLDVPSTKVFLSQYCKSFVRTGETFKVGGYGFAFRKGFNLSDANAALMKVAESGKLKELEHTFLISEKCVDVESLLHKDTSLSPHSFGALFELTGGTSTIVLAIYIIISIREFKKSTQEHTSFITLISAFIKYCQLSTRRSSKFASLESDRYTRNADQYWTQDDTDGL